MPAHLDALVRARRGAFSVDVALQADAGSVVGLLGPNGAGKTSVLRALSGLTPLTEGHVRLGGDVWDDPSRAVRLPTRHRRVGVVFQEPLLFPHRSVLDNVAFGPRHRGASRTHSRRLAAGWLERTGLSEFAGRRPGQLSGGQRQRVAITRALAAEPALLLLDEPLSALDASATLTVRNFLRNLLSDFRGVTVLVTHDALDALVLADHVVVLDGGRVEQTGPARAVAREPRSDHVAKLMGLNLVRGRAAAGVVTVADGVEVVASQQDDGDVFASFTPAAVTLHSTPPRTSARNVWPCTVVSVTPHGDAVRVHLDGPVPLLADITPSSLVSLALDEGSSVWAAVKATEVQIYPA
ncbi:MAG: sulfate/molybdate ABC transporter ATP-binding protein [Nocardioidaceae bacterium]